MGQDEVKKKSDQYKNRAKRQTERRVDRKVDDAIDSGLDAIFNRKKRKKKKALLLLYMENGDLGSLQLSILQKNILRNLKKKISQPLLSSILGFFLIWTI
jgi:hypothetical protein